jgi:probable HAF family extracellular repeat protein
MSKHPRALIIGGIVAVAIATVAVIAAAGSGRATAAKRYAYTLVDGGTFGGPGSFLDAPGVPITSQGTLLGQADVSTRDSDYARCPSVGLCGDRYIGLAAVWRDGRPAGLGALPGQNSSAIFEENGSGVGVGGSEDGLTDPFTKQTASVAVMFEHGKVMRLGALRGAFESLAQDIDNSGQIAGFSSSGVRDRYACDLFGETPPCGWATQVRAVIWRHGVISDLGTLGGPDAIVAAQNQEGEIAGTSYTSDQLGATTSRLPQAPFLWRNGRMVNLGTLGGHYGQANWLNDRGEVVGQSNLTGDATFNAFLWNGRRMIDLTPHAARSTANWINDQGDVTGWTCASLTSECTGFLWRQGKLTVLPIVGSGASGAVPNCINDHDQVVGAETDANDHEIIAALWADGHAYNLNKLLAPSSLRIISANYIDDQGDIVGYGTLPDGDQRMFLLTRNPTVPLPNS